MRNVVKLFRLKWRTENAGTSIPQYHRGRNLESPPPPGKQKIIPGGRQVPPSARFRAGGQGSNARVGGQCQGRNSFSRRTRGNPNLRTSGKSPGLDEIQSPATVEKGFSLQWCRELISMDRNLEALVWERAESRCEYCQMPQEYDGFVHEIDHAIAKKTCRANRCGQFGSRLLSLQQSQGPEYRRD